MNEKADNSAVFDEIAASCAMFATRRLSRTITRHYDAALAPSGLRSTQYNVLVAIARGRGESMTALGRVLGMDRTTLTHALRALRRDDLVREGRCDDGRVRPLALTDRGAELVASAVPLWRSAQADVEAAMGGAKAWSELNSRLRRLSKVVAAA